MLQASTQGTPKGLDDRGSGIPSRLLQGLDLGRDVGYTVARSIDGTLLLDIETSSLASIDLSDIEKRTLAFFRHPPLRRRARPHRIPRSRVKKLKAKHKLEGRVPPATRVSHSVFDMHYLRRAMEQISLSDRDYFRRHYLGEFMTETGRWKSPEDKKEAYRRAWNFPNDILRGKRASLIVDDLSV